MAQAPLPAFAIGEVDVFVEGAGSHVVLMVHGWPDTYRLWDRTVEALRDRYRCVRFSLPGYEPGSRPRATPVAGILELIAAALDRASPGRPATLLLHDWGCVFGYEFAARHPERIARVIGVDVGDHNAPAFLATLATRVKLGVIAYQAWLSMAWFLGGAAGDAMTRWMARRRGCPTDPSLIGWRMTYPYAMRWFGVAGGMRDLATVAPRHPTLYLYSRKRAGMFHSRQWLEQLAAMPGSAAREFPTGHWLMSEQPGAFASCVAEWLDSAVTPR